MKTLSQTTKVVKDNDGTIQPDLLNSLYVNMQYEVVIQEILQVTSAHEANLPGLAYSYYGDVDMWRAILVVNGLIDPISDVVAGMYLVMPTRDSVSKYLTANNATTSIAKITI